MRVKKKPNFKGYTRKLKNLNSKLAQLSNELIVHIRKRTETNTLDYKGKPLKRYTREYAKQKGTVKVTLNDTGEMLGSMDAKKINRGVKLFFASDDAKKKAYYQHVKQGRKFFMLDEKQTEDVLKKLGDFIVKTTK